MNPKSHFQVNYDWLPQAIALDDFRSGKFATSGMSMQLLNIQNHRVIDIIESRNDRALRNYFYHFSYQALASIRYVVVDLYQPYRHLIHDPFPNAQIIADHFYVIVQAYQGLQRVRIQVMNRLPGGRRSERLPAIEGILEVPAQGRREVELSVLPTVAPALCPALR